jgi:hypothetical protein
MIGTMTPKPGGVNAVAWVFVHQARHARQTIRITQLHDVHGSAVL